MSKTTLPFQLLMMIALLGCGDQQQGESPKTAWSKADKAAAATLKPGEVHLPHSGLGMATGKRDPKTGRQARIRCATCHEGITPKKANATLKQLKSFHKGIKLEHGDQTCGSCHLPPRFERFRISGGRTLPYARVMELCGQCHARQLKDYRHGAHGGMTGYWDRSRGTRDRNHCIDCHNPHRPAISKVIPAPRARYRRLAEDGAKLEGGKH